MISTNEHCIVAIGASAGGLEAIHEFFDHMPGRPDVSFIIIQHLSPDYKSLLVDLVSRHTHMQVVEAGENMMLQKNCIYVIPNNKLMTIEKNRLVLEAKKTNYSPNTAIDFFLFSLAKDKKHRAIAVILSGTGSDGTKGIEMIKKAGGMIIVQDPETAKFNGMPNSAIQSGNADFILRPKDMPEEILNYLQEPSHLQMESIDESKLDEIFTLIHEEAGNDFHYYKLPTISRRIVRRMIQVDIKNIDEYLERLRTDPEECRQLGKEFLIGVTKFFRDNDAYDVLGKEVLSKVIADKPAGETLKIWICACSTGEEAYSIAILIDNILTEQNKQLEVKIFATDIDQASIEFAARACYPAAIEKDVPRDVLKKYFLRKDNQYQIVPSIRKQIVFARHNVLKDPPFINNDLVSCRNMLIYMSPLLQQKVLSVLLYAVTIDKYLFLGSSENSALIREHVVDVNTKWKIYRKTRETRISSNYLPELGERRISKTDARYSPRPPEPARKGLWDDLKEALNEDLNFAAFHIDASFNIMDSAGSYGKFLTLPKKHLQLNLLSMVPTELYLMLSAEIKKSVKENKTVNLKNIKYRKEDLIYSWHVLIKPATPYTLIVITETEIVRADPSLPQVELQRDDVTSDYVKSLEAELSEVKGHLQFAIEDLETTNEELQSSNEELLSANEELQSSNEELQSLNEELHTLNTEHQIKIKELVELNDDLNNYFRSVDIGQVFLDKTLRIRKFNTASATTINFIESDIGRPIFHISNNIRYDGFMSDLEKVLRTNEVVEKEVSLSNGKNILMRIMPYLTREKVNSGLIISFVDITVITNLNNIIRTVLNANPSMILAFAAKREQNSIVDFELSTANHAAELFLPAERVGETLSLKKDIPVLADEGLIEVFAEIVNKDTRLNTDIYIRSTGKWYNLMSAKMMDGIVATFTDITAKKLTEEKIRKNYVELISVKDNLKKANEDLENKVIERTRALATSEERFRLVARATNDALWDWDFVNNTTWWGETFYKLFGYSQTSPETDRRFWLDKIHPDDREQVNASIHQVINTDKTQWSCEYRFLRENGTYAHILDRGYVLHDEFGTPFRMLGSMFDVTELKQAEQQVASSIAQRKFLAESMPLIVWIADQHGQLNFINRQFEVYTGVSYKEALGDGWKKLIRPQDLDPLVSKLTQSLQDKTDFSHELRLKHRNGDFRWNILRSKVSKDEDNNLIDVVITISDIHEHKVMNELLENKVKERTRKLNELNQALEVSNHDLLQFASVASHDLQEPVRKIQMFTKLLADKYSNELSAPASNYLNKIIHASGRMKLLITDILNYSRLSASDNKFQVTDLGRLLAETLEDFDITIKEKAAVITYENLPAIEVIPGQIRQVFHNLISNALKFSRPDASPEIYICGQKVAGMDFEAAGDESGNFLKIICQDNGIGFDQNFAGEIFNLFQRLHSKDKYEGTGIGLSITQKIIEKHDGLIKAESEEGFGARFVIILPVTQEIKAYHKN
ncbi:chemotaxis protein CheB [Flavitalea antarctica]